MFTTSLVTAAIPHFSTAGRDSIAANQSLAPKTGFCRYCISLQRELRFCLDLVFELSILMTTINVPAQQFALRSSGEHEGSYDTSLTDQEIDKVQQPHALILNHNKGSSTKAECVSTSWPAVIQQLLLLVACCNQGPRQGKAERYTAT